MKINAVIVTFNRKRLLLRCIKALIEQSVTLNSIYIVDNASVDGTKSFLIENKIIESGDYGYTKQIVGSTIHYVRLTENTGGAGGFHTGMKLADQDRPDYMWIMDDDGFPSVRCLEAQLKLAGDFDYVMPVSLDTQIEDKLTWFVRDRQKNWIRSYAELRSSFPGGFMEQAVPFNGLLMSRRLIDEVGYPKKEMFIWGDDFEHQFRCHQAGFKTVTALDAIFYHPEDKAVHQKIFFGKISVNFTESKLHFTCLIRNSTYNYWRYKGKHFIAAKFLMYTWFFLVKRKFAFREYLYYLKCVLDGIQGDFTRHKQFLS